MSSTPIVIVTRIAQCPACNSYDVVCVVDHGKLLYSLACKRCGEMSMPYKITAIIDAEIDAAGASWKVVE